MLHCMTVDGDRASGGGVDAISERYVRQVAALNPLTATTCGMAGHERELPDLSPAGHQARTNLARTTLGELAGVPAQLSDTDRVTVAAMRERLGLDVERAEAGEDLRALDVIESPIQNLRAVFDLMPTATEADWSDVAARLAAVPDAVAGYRRSPEAARAQGNVAARRQVAKVAAQCADYGGADGFFRSFAAHARVDGGTPPVALAGELARGADAAAEAYREFGAYLRTHLLPAAPAEDAVGPERYAMASRYFLGTSVDLAETYRWGLDELAGIEAEMNEVGRQLVPDGGVEDAIAALDADPARRIRGKERFREWMQQLSDRTLAELADTHFDIPEPIRRLDCKIAPTTTGGIYYTPPSEDFSRPGAMWWSVPAGVEDFSTWREVTTVFHEGVPGHHLQCGQTVYRAAELNRWRRLVCWVSGHGEGWALYVERLMADLGHLDDPGARMGMLDAQAFRAARVAVDIGVHLRLPVPAELGSGIWHAGNAWTFLRTHTRIGEQLLAFELDRYLGWPGQAPSYKVGERIWLQLRERVRAAEGERFDLTAFHRRALDIGSVGLDVLRQALLGERGAAV